MSPRSTARALASPVLVFEALVVALAIPVAITLTDASTVAVAVCFGGLAVLCLLAPAFLRRPWGYSLGWMLQVLVIACGVIVPAMAFLGVVFALLWILSLRLGRRIDAEKAAADPSSSHAGSGGGRQAPG